MPPSGTPEFAAYQVSRGYDCGLRVDRGAILSNIERDDRPRFLAASSSYAVKAYKAPRRCDAIERLSVQNELGRLTTR